MSQDDLKPLGALALTGAWGEVEDQEIEALVASIYDEREKEIGRPVDLEN